MKGSHCARWSSQHSVHTWAAGPVAEPIASAGTQYTDEFSREYGSTTATPSSI